jgi:transcriptional regulator with XRE-family HTH domain
MLIENGVEGVRAFVMDEMEKKEWTKKGLAEDAGLSPSTIGKFVHDIKKKRTKSPHFRTLYNIVQALGYQLRISDR